MGKYVKLLAMTMEDMPMICDMFNDDEIENNVVGWAFPISLEQQIAWYKEHLNDKGNHRLIIESPADGALGVAILSEIDWKNRAASIGIKLANKQVRGRGFGTDTLMAIMRYAFDELGLA